MLFQLKKKKKNVSIFSLFLKFFLQIFYDIYQLLQLGPLPPLKLLVPHGSPIIVLYRNHRISEKNRISQYHFRCDADRQKWTSDS